MQEIRDALLRMVRAGMKARKMQEHYLKIHLEDTEIFEIWGDILDAIYSLVGEHTETIEESATYIAMTAPILTDERRTEILYGEYRKQHPAQPRPNTMERTEMRSMMKRMGGYMTPEGDWT